MIVSLCTCLFCDVWFHDVVGNTQLCKHPDITFVCITFDSESLCDVISTTNVCLVNKQKLVEGYPTDVSVIKVRPGFFFFWFNVSEREL